VRYSHVNWALMDQAMISGVNFFTGILLARYLGIEEFGKYALVWMVVLFVNCIQHSAINSPMMSIGPKQDDEQSPVYFGAVIVQLLVFVCVVSLLLFVGSQWIDYFFPEWQIASLSLPLSLATCAVLLQNFLRRYFFVKEQPAKAFINDAIRYLGQMTILIGLFVYSRSSMDTSKVLWVITLTALSASVLGGFLVERIEINGEAINKIVHRHWQFSKWLTGSELVKWLTGNVFLIGAGALMGTAAVGAVKAAQNLMGVTHILLMGLENIVPIRAARCFPEKGKKELGDYLKRIALLGGSATLAISTAAFVASAFWLGLVFGQEYQQYGFILKWFAFVYIFIFLAMPLRIMLRTFEQTQPIFWSRFWAACFSVVMAYPLVFFFKLSGVMFGLLAIQLIIFGYLFLAVKEKL